MIGFQFATPDGVNIAGEPNDPTGGNSWEIIHPRDVDHWQEIATDLGLVLQPINEGDIEEYEFLASPPAFYTVSIFLADRAYGGPEEGGWYYDYGTRQDDWPPMIANNLNEARKLRRTVSALLDAFTNVGRPDISSISSVGVYRARVYPGYPPTHYPAHRPHYE